MKNEAQPISRDEWEKIMLLPIVAKTFCIARAETADDLERRIDGAKFTYKNNPHACEITYTLIGRYGDGVLRLGYTSGKFEKIDFK